MDIYCAAARDSETGLCAWSYIVRYKSREYTLTNIRVINSPSSHGELVAIVKALGYVKNFQDKHIVVHCDCAAVVNTCSGLANQKTRRNTLMNIRGEDKSLYGCMEPYLSRRRISFEIISREENPAYELAAAELRRQQTKEEDADTPSEHEKIPGNE